MKKLLIGIAISFTSFCFSAGLSPQAYHLVDDTTGQALVTLPSGEPEAFLSTTDKSLFVGYFTHKRIEQADPLAGQPVHELDIGARFKLRGQDQWVRVEKWCCDAYNWIEQQNDPSWEAYNNKLSREAERFGVEKGMGLDQRGGLGDCSPFISPATFLLDRKTHKPRWTKYYAVARQGRDEAYRHCERDAWLVHASADIGSTLDSKTVLVQAHDSNGSLINLQVSADTGAIVGPLPTDFTAVDATDVAQFKAEFLQKNSCPVFTKKDLGIENRYATTATGHCLVERRKRYEENVVRHFLGEPKPKPPLE